MSSRTFSICLFGLANVAWVLTSASCGSAIGSGLSHGSEPRLYEWHDDGGEGNVSVRISLTDQIAEFKRGGRNIGWCYVATGKEGHGTCPGNYSVMEKIEDKHSNRYGWIEDEFGNVTDGDAQPGDHVPQGMVYVPAPMPYWMRITSYGIGMHGGLIPEPGKPASHGCIRMPKEFVPHLYNTVNIGTPVTITFEPSNRPKKSELEPDAPRDVTRRAFGIGSGSAQSVTYHNGKPVSMQ